jgi:hypothetical protein
MSNFTFQPSKFYISRRNLPNITPRLSEMTASLFGAKIYAMVIADEILRSAGREDGLFIPAVKGGSRRVVCEGALQIL